MLQGYVDENNHAVPQPDSPVNTGNKAPRRKTAVPGVGLQTVVEAARMVNPDLAAHRATATPDTDGAAAAEEPSDSANSAAAGEEGDGDAPSATPQAPTPDSTPPSEHDHMDGWENASLSYKVMKETTEYILQSACTTVAAQEFLHRMYVSQSNFMAQVYCPWGPQTHSDSRSRRYSLHWLAFCLRGAASA